MMGSGGKLVVDICAGERISNFRFFSRATRWMPFQKGGLEGKEIVRRKAGVLGRLFPQGGAGYQQSEV